ncbi:alpha/beta fold hydrolase [Cyanothece sp. BG0011]|uniref:alpha/beta fold hydrolase n=2 Tax=Cyanothece sp. BG0011 TaxID=2082950 RepID=UPI000D1F3D0A
MFMNTIQASKINTQGTINQYTWHWQNEQFQVTYETLGQGNPILLLPAFSTVSSRTEMAGIAQLLAQQYQVYLLDWLGFGDSQRPALDYNPQLYHQLLKDFVNATFQQPVIIIAAGHTVGYALELAKIAPETVSKLILIAPTWRGPLRVMGVPQSIRNSIKNLVRTPIIGQFLYYLNTTPGFLKFMYRRHVYTDSTKLTDEFISNKRNITQQKGARFAPVAFVTGTLDPIETREDFLSLIESLSQPILTIIAEQSPPYSKQEMEAINTIDQVKTVSLPGTLGISEEFSELVTENIKNFL